MKPHNWNLTVKVFLALGVLALLLVMPALLCQGQQLQAFEPDCPMCIRDYQRGMYDWLPRHQLYSMWCVTPARLDMAELFFPPRNQWPMGLNHSYFMRRGR